MVSKLLALGTPVDSLKFLKLQKLSVVVCNKHETGYYWWKIVNCMAVFSIWILWLWDIVIIVGFSDNMPHYRIAWVGNLTWRTGLINGRSLKPAHWSRSTYKNSISDFSLLSSDEFAFCFTSCSTFVATDNAFWEYLTLKKGKKLYWTITWNNSSIVFKQNNSINW